MKWELYVNVSKAKCLCIAGNDTDLILNNIKIERFEHYRYLAVHIKRKECESQKIKYRIY